MVLEEDFRGERRVRTKLDIGDQGSVARFGGSCVARYGRNTQVA